MSRHHSIELLESRIAPAALVGTLVNGVLKLAPSDSISGINADLVQVTPDTFRLFTSAPTVDFVGVKSIVATLSDFQDSFEFFGQGNQFRGSLSILGKNGNDGIAVYATNLTGNVTISNNDPNATVGLLINPIIRGALKITTPGTVTVQGFSESLTVMNSKNVVLSGGDFRKVDIAANSTGTTLEVQNSATVRGPFVYKGSPVADTVNLLGVFVARPNIMLGDGNNFLQIHPSARFNNGVAIKGGLNTDTVTINGTNQSTFQFGGVVSFAVGDGQNTLNISDSRIGGAVRFVGGANNDNVMVQNSFLGGVLSTQLGNGNNGVLVQNGATLVGGLAVTGGVDSDFIRTYGSSVQGVARLALGNGFNEWEGGGVSFDGGFVYSGGTGNDTIDCLSSVFFRGTLTATVGDGLNNVDLDGANVFANATVTGGAIGTDNFFFQNNTVFHGNLTVRAGNGTNTLVFAPSFMSVFTYVGGADVDVLNLQGFGALTRGKAKLGGGDDIATFNGLSFITFQVDGEGGTDTLNQTGLLTLGLTALNFELPVV